MAGITPGSIAEELGLAPGDRVLEINGQPVRDIIDFRYLSADEELQVKIVNQAGEEWLLEIEKDLDEEFGLDFGENSFGATKRCHNHCVFCFVDQMAPRLRPTLYVKDDDYRLSFWQGNFITMTNLADSDLTRIITQRISPLYISIHTTNTELRQKMLNNNRAGKIMEQISRLAEAGIAMHTQNVLCPGINDGEELAGTVADLAKFWPAVCSAAVVPVGLTRYREGLYSLRTFTRQEAGLVIDQVHRWQEQFLARWDYPFIFASDEFYLQAGRPVPAAQRYADFPQTENGVGLVRLFLDEWDEVQSRLPLALVKPLKATMVTGVSAGPVLGPVVDRLNRVENLHISLNTIVNQFFGPSVTVTGLLTGSDLARALTGQDLGDLLILPGVMLKSDEDVFLDDMTLEQLAARLRVKIAVVEGPRELVELLLKEDFLIV